MSWVAIGVIIVVALFLSGFFSGAETGLYCVDRLRLHLGVRQRNPRSLRLAGVFDDEQGALSVTLIGTKSYRRTCFDCTPTYCSPAAAGCSPCSTACSVLPGSCGH